MSVVTVSIGLHSALQRLVSLNEANSAPWSSAMCRVSSDTVRLALLDALTQSQVL